MTTKVVSTLVIKYVCIFGVIPLVIECVYPVI